MKEQITLQSREVQKWLFRSWYFRSPKQILHLKSEESRTIQL